jgi:predicted RNA-binding Zn ribbon-like protein
VQELRTDKFTLIGGHVALDFTNTVSDRSDPKNGGDPNMSVFRVDKFGDFVDLVSWGSKAGLLSEEETAELLRGAESNPEASKKFLKKAIGLRETLFRLFRAAAGKWAPDPKDLASFNAELLAARKRERLEYTAEGFGLTWAEDLPGAMLRTIVREAADLFASDRLSKIKTCGGPQCGWLFLDESRSHNRQWCDMKDCGNRAKVQRFRKRRAVV